MLILDVGKIKYNKKFYKAIIYTTLVMDIISFGIFPKSQSKYKDELQEAVRYSTSLYAERKLEPVQGEDVNIKEADIRLIDINSPEYGYKYTSNNKNAFFEYSIPSDQFELDYEKMNENIAFTWETVNAVNGSLHGDGNCSVIQYQKSKDTKGIVLCKTTQDDNDYFGKYGIKLKINASYEDVKNDYIEYKEITTNVSVDVEGSYGAGQYQTFIESQKEPTRIVLDSPNNKNGCDAFNEWLRYYSEDYYPLFDNYYRNNVVPYLAQYNISGSSCSLVNLDIPGIKYEPLEIEVESSNATLLRYAYTIKDNFLGYARTYTDGINSKAMFFTTKDGRSFSSISPDESSIWETIFREYLEKLYPNDVTDFANYIAQNNGILHLLQRTEYVSEVANWSDVFGIDFYPNDGNKVVISLPDNIRDEIFNETHKSEGRLRVTILNVSDTSSVNEAYMWTTVDRNLKKVFGGLYSEETLDSLLTLGTVNEEQALKISDYMVSSDLTSTGESVDIVGLGTDAGQTFTVHVYSDGTYNWFTILPAGTTIDENTMTYTLKPNSSSVYTLNRFEGILDKIKILDKYYNISEHTSVNEGITYMYNGNELKGYVQISFEYDNNHDVKSVIYTAYIGSIDPSVITPDEADVPTEVGSEEEALPTVTDKVEVEESTNGTLTLPGEEQTGVDEDDLEKDVLNETKDQSEKVAESDTLPLLGEEQTDIGEDHKENTLFDEEKEKLDTESTEKTDTAIEVEGKMATSRTDTSESDTTSDVEAEFTLNESGSTSSTGCNLVVNGNVDGNNQTTSNVGNNNVSNYNINNSANSIN